MTAAKGAPVVPGSGEGWTVPVNMPYWASGKHRGQPVGWINLNEKIHPITCWKMTKQWRQAAADAYRIARLPRGLPRIHVQIVLRFTTNRSHRNAPNYEPTIKPVIDALQPQSIAMRREKNGALKPVVSPGVGVVAGDDKRYIDLGEVLIGDALGRDPRGPAGQIIVHITPLPAGET